MKTWIKWIITIIVVVVIGFAGYKWFGSRASAQTQVRSISRTAVVQQGNLQVTVSGSGTVSPVTTEDITSTINNNSIDQVLVSAGQSVKKGAVLITFTDGSDPITAPADGVITAVNVLPGERVSIGQAVAHLTNYSDLETVAAIDEMDIPKVKLGQTATIQVNALPDQTFTGKVTAIANEGTSTNGVSTFNVTVSIDNPTGLRVGMTTEANILTASKNNAIYVPVDAVHDMGGRKFVMLANQNQNQNQNNQNNQQGNNGFNQWSNSRVMVQTGLENSDYVEITQGLTPGQVVRLPNLTIGSSTSTNGRMQGFGGLGGMGGGRGGFGGGNRGGGNGGFGGSGGGSRQASGGNGN